MSTKETLNPREISLINLINKYRQDNNLEPLQVSIKLTKAAQEHAKNMASKNYLSHIDSYNRDPFMRMTSHGYDSNALRGENVAGGNPSAEATLKSWEDACDPNAAGTCTYAHRQNLLNPEFKMIGVGEAYNPNSTFGYYWVADFGDSNDSTINNENLQLLPTSTSPFEIGPTAIPTTNTSGNINNTGVPTTTSPTTIFSPNVIPSTSGNSFNISGIPSTSGNTSGIPSTLPSNIGSINSLGPTVIPSINQSTMGSVTSQYNPALSGGATPGFPITTPGSIQNLPGTPTPQGYTNGVVMNGQCYCPIQGGVQYQEVGMSKLNWIIFIILIIVIIVVIIIFMYLH